MKRFVLIFLLSLLFCCNGNSETVSQRLDKIEKRLDNIENDLDGTNFLKNINSQKKEENLIEDIKHILKSNGVHVR